MKKFGIVGIAFCVAQSWLLGVPELHLPAGTPGRQENAVGQPILAAQNGKQCEHITVPGTNCHLYFPVDGSQPSTADAGAWSGARYNDPDNNRVTDWWVRVFGGNLAVNQIHRGMYDTLAEPEMGFNATGQPHIIQIDTTIAGTPAGFEQQFWQTFREIASDPVGRVLLYRLLIEIRRTDNVTHEGCCEDGIATIIGRNDLRSIEIKHTNDGFAFSPGSLSIEFDLTDTAVNTMILSRITNKVATTDDPQPDTLAIGLFHEMLHWFHFLRHPNRFEQSDSEDPAVYRYLLRSYYGDQGELYTWGSIDDEEIRTILGAPDYRDPTQLKLINTGTFFYARSVNGIRVSDRFFLPEEGRFLNSDDLSENAFRLSTHLHGRICHMRFGHGDNIISVSRRENRFRLANYVAKKCYADITGIQII